ncbi:MAG TPA: phospholipase D-like domain-containing protein [Methylomirabilota bacterium]|jgi:cardiolipin synthase|nr:phospholipase D-like domain-containing protein [Methylomirabilota bacterium]
MRILSRCLPRLLAGLLVIAGAGCVRVNPHVALPALSLGEPSFFPTLEAYASAPIVGGNAVELLLNGEQIFPAIVDAIRGARQTITYAQYFYEDGPVARDIAEAMAERCRAGVGASVLLDAFGALNMPPEYADLMQRSGCHVAYFRPLGQYVFRKYNNRNHRRGLVVDGRLGLTGGSGVSRKWMGNGRVEGHWRDTDVRVEGPVVEYLQAAFAQNWLEATGMVLGGEAYFPRPLEPRGQVFAQVVKSSPSEGSFSMYTTFLLAVSSARRSIYITNPYFVLDEKMQEAVERAARRGVRVSVLVPGAIDHNIVRQASRAQFGQMLKAGVEIYEYTAALLHSKTIVIDGVWVTIGSTNLDNRSFAVNDEMNLIIYNRGVAGQLERIFMDDVAHSRKVEYETWRKRGIGSKLLEILALPIRDLL